ncbi:MAG: hypothetical protein OEZ39_18905 [Gammaproteobacteria bacterium]|nr:hypothetical protein [Gammaproteobacteria bacterium]MDH5653935.1 hypothetical protein [Gammaproteobacteria bacterium]
MCSFMFLSAATRLWRVTFSSLTSVRYLRGCFSFARHCVAEASDFLLRGQEKVTKEKAALAALML